MLSHLTSFATIGLKSERIEVEVGVTNGDQKFFIVGLGDAAVQESKHRVMLALRSSQLRLPFGRRIVVNLAPANIRKIGPRYDLPIALGLLLAEGMIEVSALQLDKTAILGELALDGSVRHVPGILSAALGCKEHGIETIVVPAVNAAEAALVPGLNVIPVSHIKELIDILCGLQESTFIPPSTPHTTVAQYPVDFADVRGQQQAKRALVIAAAGGHNVLLSGAPGSGKTLLTQALRGILPPLTLEEALEVTQIYSVANLLPEGKGLMTERPFRTVHHTASGVSIVGGGQIPGPGEVSLAHRGVLFLDELAEFPAQVLEVLRQPLEDRKITITRAQGSVTFPADVLLVAAMNPPQFSAGSERKIKSRISAPFLDRIDLAIDVLSVPIEELQQKEVTHTASSADLRLLVEQARNFQKERFKDAGIVTNKEMSVRNIRTYCVLDAASEELLKQAAVRLKLSARSFHRTIKTARTIADLDASPTILKQHIAEALQYRQHASIEGS